MTIFVLFQLEGRLVRLPQGVFASLREAHSELIDLLLLAIQSMIVGRRADGIGAVHTGFDAGMRLSMPL